MVIQKILDLRFLPIVDFHSLKNPRVFFNTLLEQDVKVIQINFKNTSLEDSVQVISDLVSEFPEMSIGAGFIYDTATAEIVLKNKFHFIVSAVLATEILPIAQKYNVPAILSALSPTEINKANQLTPDLVQIFPASQVPVRSIISLLEHLPYANLMLTGGLTLSASLDLLAAGVKAVGVKGAIFQKEHLLQEDYDAIAKSLLNFKTRVQKLDYN